MYGEMANQINYVTARRFGGGQKWLQKEYRR